MFIYQWRTLCGSYKVGMANSSPEERMRGYAQQYNLIPVAGSLQSIRTPFAAGIERHIKRTQKRTAHPSAKELFVRDCWPQIEARARIEQARYDELVAGKAHDDGKRLCQLTTPQCLVEELFSVSGAHAAGAVLVPGAGDGSFSYFTAQRNNRMDTLVEIDNSMMDGLHHLANGSNIHIINADFLTHDFGDYKPEVVIGNPPFQQAEGTKQRQYALDFFLRSAKLVRDGGSVAMIMPSNWRGVKAKGHNQKYLRELCSLGSFVWARSVAREEFSVAQDIDLVVYIRGRINLPFILNGVAIEQPIHGAWEPEIDWLVKAATSGPKIHVTSVPRPGKVTLLSAVEDRVYFITKNKMLVAYRSIGHMKSRYEFSNGDVIERRVTFATADELDEDFFKSACFRLLKRAFGVPRKIGLTADMLNLLSKEFVSGAWRDYEVQAKETVVPALHAASTCH